MPPPDQDLLSRYLASRDEAAFRLLVERHLPLVHGVARRVTGNEEMARDVSQRTLIRLAERAALVPRNASLPAWLHRIARDPAIDLVRAEDRRKKREAAALLNPSSAAMDEMPEPAWSALTPLIDEVVSHLPAADRDLVLLRFYQGQPHAVIARQLGLTEQAARKRSLRALERRRVLLGKRGIVTTASALWTLLPAHAATSVPPALMTSVLRGVHGVAPHLPGGLQVALHAMNATQKSLVAGAAVVFLLSAAYSLRPNDIATGRAATVKLVDPSLSQAASTPRSRHERSLTVDAGGRLERLREILAISSHVSRTREMMAFFDLLPPGQFTEIAEDLKQLNALKSDVTILFGPSWAKLDPVTAAAWALDQPGPLRGSILQTWGAASPLAAIAWVQEHAPGSVGGKADANHGNALGEVLGGAAQVDPAAVTPFLESLSDPAALRLFATMMAGALWDQTPGFLDPLLAVLKPCAFRSYLISQSIGYLTRGGQGARALDLILSNPGVQEFKPLDQFFQEWCSNDALGLKNHLNRMPESPLKAQAVIAFCQGAYNDRVVDAFELMRRYPAAATDINIAKIADNCPVEHSALALDQIFQMRTPSARDEMLTRRLSWWKARDADAAALWINSHDLSAAVKEAVKNAPAEP